MRFSNDPSEEMILQNEWRRDRMHEAVDKVESYVHGRCPNGHEANKTCLIRNCFAWCLEHQAISTEADGEEVIRTHIADRDRNGNIQERVEHKRRRRCSTRRQNPDEGNRCDIVVSDYMDAEWEREEYNA